jgi:hypothetical protein
MQWNTRGGVNRVECGCVPCQAGRQLAVDTSTSTPTGSWQSHPRSAYVSNLCLFSLSRVAYGLA